MHSRRLVFVLAASLLAVAACATGASPLGGGGSTGNGDNNDGMDSGSAYGGDDSGSVIPDGGLIHPVKDSGTVTPIDSGTGPIDSGTVVTGSFCTGEKSSRRNDYNTKNYDDWCDESAYYGFEFDCTSNSDCTGHFTSGYEPECCYQPIGGGYCEGDFGGTPQCVPQ